MPGIEIKSSVQIRMESRTKIGIKSRTGMKVDSEMPKDLTNSTSLVSVDIVVRFALRLLLGHIRRVGNLR
ncbi:hypothetical protein EVAR_90820_1 [Eumeta japonica]|uniref:Uncharacterized protein n=1 Tax=Eumeta variegata TaxID=151549 RepID=A0A4C1SB75_EUMVA|nr:hypothetical protein EVAR_90820_1 [Eumeta japonica]